MMDEKASEMKGTQDIKGKESYADENCASTLCYVFTLNRFDEYDKDMLLLYRYLEASRA